MSDTVHLVQPCLPPANIKEILVYAGCRTSDDAVVELINECIDDVLSQISCRACYTVLDVNSDGDRVRLGKTFIDSKDLAKNLFECRKAVVFAVTLGLGVDRLISKYSHVSPSRALVIQAIGAERIEAACDSLEDILSNGGKTKLCARFSPGYGDLALDFQKNIFGILDCERKIGITLNESLLISPSKSVTAIVGIK